MTTIQPKQIQQLQVLCSGKFQSREERLDCLSDMVGTKLETVKDLTSVQAEELIYFFKNGKELNHASWAIFDKYNKKHRAILSLCHQLSWVQDDNPSLVDLNRLGCWLKSKKSPVCSPLKEMTSTELSKIITALTNMVTKKLQPHA